MDLINKNSILQEIPLFADFSDEERYLIGQKCNFVDYKKGQIIYAEGSPPDAFYCIILGRVVIYTRDPQGNMTTLEYLHRGKYFGIISLLTSDAHSVTAEAINDCFVLVIKKEDFDFILNKIPRLAIDLSRSLSRRLKRKDVHQKTIFESTVVSVFSSYSPAGKTIYVLNLALSLTQETHKSILVIDIAPEDKIHSLPRRMEIEGDIRVLDIQDESALGGKLGLDLDLSANLSEAARIIKGYILKNKFGLDLICLHYKPGDSSSVKKLIAILVLLVNDYHYIILDLPSSMDISVFGMLNQSDLIHILTSPEPVDIEKTYNLIERLKTECKFASSKINIVVNEYKLSKLTPQEQTQRLENPIFATLPKIDFGAPDRLVLDCPDCEYAKAVRRISRRLGDCLVGLALGVGVAYGFCHIGVLKVIEEEDIPVDVICGSSVGALIAGLWATGRSSQEILEITQEFKGPQHIWNIIDLTFPLIGFIKGNKLYAFLKKHLGNKTFYDVKLPLKIVASDVERKETKILDKGSLVDAIMTSCAMPGVFIPYKYKEIMLLDGGIISPLPTEPLFKMGIKKIIAVNVTPSHEDILRQYDKMKGELAALPLVGKKGSWFSWKEYLKNKFRINVLDLVFSSVEVMQSKVAEQEAQFADVVLHPDTSGMHWLELHRAAEFAKRGEEEARRNLDKIRQLIRE